MIEDPVAGAIASDAGEAPVSGPDFSAPAFNLADAEALIAVDTALTRIDAPTDDDRSAGLIAIYRVLNMASHRQAWLSRIALEAIREHRHLQARRARRGIKKGAP